MTACAAPAEEAEAPAEEPAVEEVMEEATEEVAEEADSTAEEATEEVAEEATEETGVQQVYAKYGDVLAEPCIGWAVSKVDSKLERESKTAIDDIFGGEVDYSKVCNAFVF